MFRHSRADFPNVTSRFRRPVFFGGALEPICGALEPIPGFRKICRDRSRADLNVRNLIHVLFFYCFAICHPELLRLRLRLM